MDKTGNSVGQKRRGRPFNPEGIDPVIFISDGLPPRKGTQPLAQPEAETAKSLQGYPRTAPKRIGSREGAGARLQIRPLRPAMGGHRVILGHRSSAQRLADEGPGMNPQVLAFCLREEPDYRPGLSEPAA